VDHPGTQRVKIEKGKEIFGFLPDHVIYVPVDFETDNFGERLLEQGTTGRRKLSSLWKYLLCIFLPRQLKRRYLLLQRIQAKAVRSSLITSLKRFRSRLKTAFKCVCRQDSNLHGFASKDLDFKFFKRALF
jgi:O-methyltransferase involved in polyketide biosynthesis